MHYEEVEYLEQQNNELNDRVKELELMIERYLYANKESDINAIQDEEELSKEYQRYSGVILE